MLIADDDRVYLDCNPAAESLLDCPRNRIIGSHIEDFTALELREQVPLAWATFLEAGTEEGSWELVVPNGKRINVEYSATANITPGRHFSIFMPVTEPLVSPSVSPDQTEKPLSPREREILTRIAFGDTGEQIATELFISPETVRTHIRNVLLKLGARTRPHAVALGLQRGEITPGNLGASPQPG
jgi:DNA-binding CsgD family transcriptional regulator